MRRKALHVFGTMTGAEKTSNSIATVAFVVAAFSMHDTSCEGPTLRIGVAQQAFLNAKPRIGLVTNVQNDGAKAGTFISGSLSWDSVVLRMVMTSPRLDSWTYTDKGMMKEAEKTTFTFVYPFHIQGHSSQPATFWFSRDEKPGDRLFTSGAHTLEVRLYDGIQSDPVVTWTFHCTLEPQQINDIYDKGNETTEFTISLVFDK